MPRPKTATCRLLRKGKQCDRRRVSACGTNTVQRIAAEL
jgi:hypothetical protein